MQTPLLVIFIGVPGSGKTFFATRLAKKIGAIRLNSDAMRLAIFGSLRNIESTYHSRDRKLLNSHTFGAMDYVTREILKSGKSVIYEAIQRTQKDRKSMEQLASLCKARLVLVSIEIDDELAIQRVQEREVSMDVRRLDAKRAREAIEHFRDNLEPLERTDYLVRIDGTDDFEKQFHSFVTQLKAMS